jgi:alpha-amylase/alpha-mannosidase (GH57 family)
MTGQPGRGLDLVLLWHMHQPDYRDHATGRYSAPWVYLHAIKDYTDMAAHLERHPGVRCVVNFVPVLLEQIEDYAAQCASGEVRDPLLALLAREDDRPFSPAERDLVLRQCFRANHEKVVNAFPAYRALFALFSEAQRQGAAAFGYLSDRYLYDLVTWYHLGWTGETVRRESPTVARLVSRGANFSPQDRRALFGLVGELVRGIIPRYRALAEGGRIELSTTPDTHPMAPLLLDFASARESTPGAPLPRSDAYPGGLGRVHAHLDAAFASHVRRFGAAPTGLWPAEGGVSLAFARVAAARGCRWLASGEAVLAASLRPAAGEERARWLYRPYRVDGSDATLFFRDDRLSDRIGFDYAKWHSRDAASDLVTALDGIARGAGGTAPLVSIILDGENCWEYYPYNGYYFLEALYGDLEAHPRIRTTTFAAVLEEIGAGTRPAPTPLPGLVAGSWVAGSFATWIGTQEKNRAWDLLCAAKQAFDLVAAGGRLPPGQLAAAERQLATCESSDWFWWLAAHNPDHAVAAFDALYRAHLAQLYRSLGLVPPGVLEEPLCHGTGSPEAGGTMRRSA